MVSTTCKIYNKVIKIVWSNVSTGAWLGEMYWELTWPATIWLSSQSRGGQISHWYTDHIALDLYCFARLRLVYPVDGDYQRKQILDHNWLNTSVQYKLREMRQTIWYPLHHRPSRDDYTQDGDLQYLLQITNIKFCSPVEVLENLTLDWYTWWFTIDEIS